MRTLLLAGLAGVILTTPGARAQFAGTGELAIDQPADKEDIPSVPAPKGALVLFGGKEADLGNWVGKDGQSPAKWLVTNGALQVVRSGTGSSDIMTREQFGGRFKLHVEFRIPYLPDRKGQARGNSGVFLQGRYEVQVLDAYHNDTDQKGMCGAIYGLKAPSENVAKAPTIWQSFDIDFCAPKFQDGKKVEPTVMTVWWNGVKVHDHFKLATDNTRSGLGGDPATPGPILLQDHANPVQFRNLWLLPLR